MDEEFSQLDRDLELLRDVEIEHPRLRGRVWSRIANEDKEPAALPSFFRLVQGILSRPIYATVFVLACVLGGLLLAELRVVHLQAERNGQLAESYKQVIDPLIKNTYLSEN